MNKYLKGCLIFLGVIILLVSLFIGWFLLSMQNRTKRAEKDSITYSKVCDTTSVITEKPPISLGNFEKSEIEQLKFYIIRNKKIIEDTLILYEITDSEHYLYTEIPFPEFQKTDAIVVETKSKKYFNISGFHHYAYLHYGMFGYVGSHDCRFADDSYIVNGKHSNGYLLKENAMDSLNMNKKHLTF